ncbi:binding-protein-dependent transport system inner membrane protein [Thermincola ferriacetica]|uniref:Binding-protein-dependent transport system inner membrane protein n=1 Tax=Thermincola ferriacetica TaxID=281456 RepID=A0A0L6W0M4_9FIRM|nr:ABC transporter permease [Thermincola ferriacetica]KNZ69137.1 binding-protein-dependent transport system inner membrane protein [Thermincola ferriacetica]
MDWFICPPAETANVQLKGICFRKKINWVFLRVLSIITVLGLWQVLVSLRLLELPSPWETIKTFIYLLVYGDPLFNKTLVEIVWSSLQIVIKACLLSFAVAIPLGILMGTVTWVRQYVDSVLEMLRPIPPLAWIPLAYVIFARAGSPTECVQVFVVFIGAFFPVLLDTIHGINMVSGIYVEAAMTMGASRWQILTRIMLPGALPSIFNGIRVGFGVGWMCIVAAEFVGGKLGIGYYIWSSYSIGGREAEIISGIIAIGLVGTAINRMVLFLEERLIQWR